jgi:hypothetical protein
MRYQPWHSKFLAALAITALLGACAAMRAKQENAKSDRGIKFDHAQHTSEPLSMACDMCHDPSSGEPAMPTHDTCSVCHEIKIEEFDLENCAICHSDPELVILPYEKQFSDEIIFSHAPHVAAEVACTDCHENPDEGVLPKGDVMAACMDCHDSTGNEALNECSVCHTELRADVVPKFRGDVRIAHDAPEIWEHVHGQEARIDEAYCGICHTEKEAFCADCHQKNPPRDHTLTWQRRTHGLEAAWDRDKCSVCHEEDSCTKCHENTQPSSHRGSFARGQQTHCASCHFPPQNNSCTVCHENIEHRSAGRSPHALGIYPNDCGRCHPGGMPDRAPHFVNSTVRCFQCHN